MTNFTIPGTKLPMIPEGTKMYVGAQLGSNEFKNDHDEYYSYGQSIRNGEVFIRCEKQFYNGHHCFEVNLELIRAFAKAQGFTGEKVVGYKVPFDMYDGFIQKDEIYIQYKGNDKLYIPESKKNAIAPAFYSIPKEIVEQWEPMYEKIEKMHTFLLGSSKTQVTISKNKIIAEGSILNISELSQLFQPSIKELERHKQENGIFTYEEPYKVELIDATYKIGCNTIKLDELKGGMSVYHHLQKE